MLVLERDRGVAREVLAEALWPEGLPPTWSAALRGIVSRVRAFAGQALAEDGEPLPVSDGRYALRLPDDVVVDVELAEWAVAAGQEALAAGDPDQARRMAEGALPCLRDSFLGDHDSTWVAGRRAHLAELLITALEVVSRAASTSGDTLAALTAATEAVTRAPLRESAHRGLMAAHVAAGNRAEALRAYQRLRRSLAEEIGVDPAPETEAAYLDLLGPPPSRDRPDGTGAAAEGRAAPRSPGEGPVLEALTVLTDAWERASAGERCLVRVSRSAAADSGDPIVEAARRASATGGLVLFGRGDEARPSTSCPYQPLVDALDPFVAVMLDGLGITDSRSQGELRRVFPSLSRPAQPGAPADEDVFFEAVAGVVAAAAIDRPVMIVLDDLDRADPAALRLLGHLVRRTAGVRLLVVAVAQDGVLSPDHPLWALEQAAGGESWFRHVVVSPSSPSEPSEPSEPSDGSATAGAGERFPAMAVALPIPGRLPTYTTSFVGREDDCGRILAALRINHVVTLTGEGGIGKTRLAIEAAQRATLADHPDGVRFCDLSSIPDADSLVEHIAADAGAPIPPGSGVRQALVTVLRSSQMLLVLDNCDRLRTQAAELLDEIVTTAPGLRVLATSRAPLRTQGETVLPVQPLGWPRPDSSDIDRVGAPASTPRAAAAAVAVGAPDQPAVRLLVDRARAAGATVADDDPTLGEITRRLDDIPLAIELVAPRLTTMPADVLAPHLVRIFDVLGDSAEPSGAGRPHRRTLQATIGWSFELLSAEAQHLLSGLSVFAGGWTLEDAEVVVAQPLGLDRRLVARLMAELVEQSMIRLVASAVAPARYTMLAPIQAYAFEMLARSGRQQEIADRHAEHFIGLAERAVPHRRGPSEPVWVSRLAQELDNLRAAYRWSLDARPTGALRLVGALADDIVMREQLEFGRWAEELVTLPELAEVPCRATALAIAGQTAVADGRLDDAWRLSCEALDAERRTGSNRAAPVPRVTGSAGTTGATEATGATAATHAARAPRAAGAWAAHNTQGLVMAAGVVEGDWTEPFRAMFDIARDTGDPWPAAVAHYAHVQLPALVGQPELGRDHAAALVDMASRSGNPTMRAMAGLARGIIEAPTDPDLASREYHRALEAATTAHNTLLIQQALRGIEELNARNDRATALAALRTITRRFERSGDVSQQIQTILTMLDSVVAVGALTAAATICGALSQTHWRGAEAYRVIDREVAEAMPPDDYLAARRAGATLSPSDLVSYVSKLVDDLVAG